jgi:hypothetical protein
MAEPNAQPDVDLYELSDEDFLKQFEAAKAAEKTDPADEAAPVVDQPRDENGRFIKKEDTAEPTPAEEFVYTRSIDLGDGSGVQVFEADSLEELVDKLATAQEHASRKIRELSAAKKVDEPKKTDETTEDEDWLLSQELMSSPSKAFPKLIKKAFGKDPDAIRTDLEELETSRKEKRQQAVVKQFMTEHPDLPFNPYNGTVVERHFKAMALEVTPENLERVFKELGDNGLLKPNAATKEDETPTTDPTKQRIAAPAGTTVVVRKKAASGLSAKQSVAAPELTTEDLYNLPMAEFEKIGGMSKQDNW